MRFNSSGAVFVDEFRHHDAVEGQDNPAELSLSWSPLEMVLSLPVGARDELSRCGEMIVTLTLSVQNGLFHPALESWRRMHGVCPCPSCKASACKARFPTLICNRCACLLRGRCLRVPPLSGRKVSVGACLLSAVPTTLIKLNPGSVPCPFPLSSGVILV